MIAVDFSVDDMNQCYSTMKCQMEFHPITMEPMLQTVNAIVLIDITGLQSVQWFTQGMQSCQQILPNAAINVDVFQTIER